MRERNTKLKRVSFETMLRICGPKANETKCKAVISREYNEIHTHIHVELHKSSPTIIINWPSKHLISFVSLRFIWSVSCPFVYSLHFGLHNFRVHLIAKSGLVPTCRSLSSTLNRRGRKRGAHLTKALPALTLTLFRLLPVVAYAISHKVKTEIGI